MTKHIQYNHGIIRPRGKRWQAEFTLHYHTKRYTCDTLNECHTWIDARRIEAQNLHKPLSARELLEAAEARTLLPLGVGLRDAAEFYATHHAAGRVDNAPIEEVFKKFLEDREAAGLRQRSLEGLRSLVGRLARTMSGRRLLEISTADLQAWLAQRGYQGVTREGFRRAWMAFWNYAIQSGYTSFNPAKGLSVLQADDRSPGIYEPAQVQRLIDSARQHRPTFTPFLAIGFFAGLRTAELMELEWPDVGPTYIRVRPEVAKKRRRRLVTILPNLKALLLPERKETGYVCPVRPSASDRWLHDVVSKAAVGEWVPNGMRHSFASYHLAYFRDAGRTAAELGHTDTVILYEHYRELVTRQAAKAYFSIGKTPAG